MTVPASPDAVPARLFDALYERASDPWNFAHSRYEQGRYDAILAALSRPHYPRAFEPGCSVGELTAKLALRCGELLATDVAPSAVAAARERCRAFAHLTIRQADLSGEIPAGPFDLIVLSEIGYYFSACRLASIADNLAQQLAPGGELIAAHWLGCSADHLLHGDEVHAVLKRQLPLLWRKGARHPGFRIDAWVSE